MIDPIGASKQVQITRSVGMVQSETPMTVLLSRSEAAAYLGIKPKTLANWASMGRYDLKIVKIGERIVRYRKLDLDLLIERGIFITCKKDADHE